MGRFSGLGSTKISNSGVYFPPNERFVVDIEACKLLESRKDKSLHFVIETKIVESTTEERKPGSTCSQVIPMQGIMSFSNIKAFLAAANGIDPKDEAAVEEALGDDGVAEEVAEAAVDESNPLEGTRLNLETTLIKTQKGNDFTKHSWTPYD